jgi:hypothetical protein
MSLLGDKTFPCRLDRLPEFLGTAKWFGEAATTIPLPRRGNEKLLDATTIWQVPPLLALPKGRLRIE